MIEGMGRRRLIGGLAAGLGLTAAPGLAQAKSKHVEAGQPAPAFSVYTFDNRKVVSSELAGRVVVLNYWATWCAPCRAEMLVFDAYLRRHKGADLDIFAVATESSLPDKYLRPLSKAVSFPLVHNLMGKGYGVIDKGVPTSYVIDRAGVVRHAAAGAFDEDEFKGLIDGLLAEKA